MEHRYYERKEVLADLVIRNQRGLIQQGKARNFSREGMYIEVVSSDIRKGGMLDIELSNECCLRGWVIYTDVNGIGVLFVPPTNGEVDKAFSAPLRSKENRR